MKRNGVQLLLGALLLTGCGAGVIVGSDKGATTGAQSLGGPGPACPAWGWYCGGANLGGGDATHLYYCAINATTSIDLGQCGDGKCHVAPNGQPDFCDGGSSQTTNVRYPGYGWWCGGAGTPLNSGQSNHLYFFDDNFPTDLGQCSNGCSLNVATADSCKAGAPPPNPGTTNKLWVVFHPSAIQRDLAGLFQCVLGETQFNDFAKTYPAGHGRSFAWGGQVTAACGVQGTPDYNCAVRALQAAHFTVSDHDIVEVVFPGACGGENTARFDTAVGNGIHVLGADLGDGSSNNYPQCEERVAVHEAFENAGDWADADCCTGETSADLCPSCPSSCGRYAQDGSYGGYNLTCPNGRTYYSQRVSPNKGGSSEFDPNNCQQLTVQQPPPPPPPGQPLNFTYPNPRYANGGGQGPAVHTACVNTGALSSHGHLDKLIPEMISEAGLAGASAPCDYTITFVGSPPALSGNAASTWNQAGSSSGRYIVLTNSSGSSSTATAYAPDEQAAMHATRVALQLLSGGKVTAATVVDFPSLALNGVVEGIYGSPPSWSVSDRTSVIRLMSRLRESAFIYAPKGDDFTRAAWRSPYTPAAGDQVRTAAHEADADLVTFYWAISPGLDYQFTGADFNNLTNKLANVHGLGVSHFALFLDDINAAFDYNTGVAHANLINAVDDWIHSHIDPNHTLLTVGTNYAIGPTQYSNGMGATLHGGVQVMWTGNAVEPSTMSAGDMNAINASLRRKVAIWDNWPNAAGSFTGRSGDLHNNVSSYFTNPVLNEQPGPWLPTRTFLQVLGPVADYLADMERYNAGASYNAWQPVLNHLMGIVAPNPGCGSNAVGWTCTADHQSIVYCDGNTHTLTTLPCPGGCQTMPNPNPDICN